jgi:hypothetical protein
MKKQNHFDSVSAGINFLPLLEVRRLWHASRPDRVPLGGQHWRVAGGTNRWGVGDVWTRVGWANYGWHR